MTLAATQAMSSISCPVLLQELLEETALKWPDREAIIHGAERKTYRHLDEEANRTSHALRRVGVNPGDRVGLLMPNSSGYVTAYFGILKAGAVAVPLQETSQPETLAHILRDAGIRVLIASSRFRRTALTDLVVRTDLQFVFWHGEKISETTQITARKKWQIIPIEEALAKEPPKPPSAKGDPRNLACLFYTSGSAGKPKGVMLSHFNLLENTKSIVQYLDISPADKAMVVLPFSYCYGASILHTHFLAGGSLVLSSQFLYPNLILDLMEAEEVTGFSGVPYTFAILLRRSNLRNYKLKSLRYVTQAGGTLAPALIQEFRSILPHAKFYVMYGQTEASARLSYLPPECLDSKLGSIGKGIPGVELKVLDERGIPTTPGQVGEIVARGPNVMLGYWNSPAETSRVLNKRGLYTGDLARVDEDGFIYIVGRKKDFIKAGSHRVSAREVEEVILEEPSVLECAVVGVEDEMMGEAVKAFIVPADWGQRDAEKILNWCRQRLASYKVPKSVEFRRTLPKNAAGKVVKPLLKAVKHD